MDQRKHFPNTKTYSFYLIANLFLHSACTSKPYAWRGTAYDPPKLAPDFSISHETGNSFTLSERKGTIILLYFGYTFYPDVCPATAAIMSSVFTQLEPSPDEIQFVMMSIDPERETPEAVDEYMRRFHPDFIGLWSERDQLEKIQEDYDILAMREPSENPETYLITHTARVFLIDQQGFLRAHYPFGSIPEDFIMDLTYLIEH